jgi:hypothetical protein
MDRQEQSNNQAKTKSTRHQSKSPSPGLPSSPKSRPRLALTEREGKPPEMCRGLAEPKENELEATRLAADRKIYTLSDELAVGLDDVDRGFRHRRK